MQGPSAVVSDASFGLRLPASRYQVGSLGRLEDAHVLRNFTAPLYIIQFAFALERNSAITYALLLDIGNFTSAICIAFATSA
jgi:hypothetical protein